MAAGSGSRNHSASGGFSLVEVIIAASFLAFVMAGSSNVINGLFRSQRAHEIISSREEIKRSVKRSLETFSVAATVNDYAVNPEFVGCKHGAVAGFICEEGKKYGLNLRRTSGVVIAGSETEPGRYRANGTPCAAGESASSICPIEVVASFSPECNGQGVCHGRVARFRYECEVRGASGVDLSRYGLKELAPSLCTADEAPAVASGSPVVESDASMVPGLFFRDSGELCRSAGFKGNCSERRVQGGKVLDIRVPENTTLVRYGRKSGLIGHEAQFPVVYKAGSVIWADGSNFGLIDSRFQNDDFFVVDNSSVVPRKDPRKVAGVQAAAYLCQGKRVCDVSRVPDGMTFIHGEVGVPVQAGSAIPDCVGSSPNRVSRRCFTILLRSVLVDNSEIY